MTRRKVRWIKGIKDLRNLSYGIYISILLARETISRRQKKIVFLGKEAKTVAHKVLGM
jgi:hypothetical protein